jgi:hypothetical protein
VGIGQSGARRQDFSSTTWEPRALDGALRRPRVVAHPVRRGAVTTGLCPATARARRVSNGPVRCQPGPLPISATEVSRIAALDVQVQRSGSG